MLEPGGEGPKPRLRHLSAMFEHRNGEVTFVLQHYANTVPGRPGRGTESVHGRLVEADSNLLL